MLYLMPLQNFNYILGLSKNLSFVYGLLLDFYVVARALRIELDFRSLKNSILNKV